MFLDSTAKISRIFNANTLFGDFFDSFGDYDLQNHPFIFITQGQRMIRKAPYAS